MSASEEWNIYIHLEATRQMLARGVDPIALADLCETTALTEDKTLRCLAVAHECSLLGAIPFSTAFEKAVSGCHKRGLGQT